MSDRAGSIRVGRAPIAATCAVAAIAFAACVVPPPESADAVWVRIPEGASIEAVSESLAVHGIVESAGKFERYARFGRRYLEIEPGLYALRPGTHIGKVLVTLRRGTEPVRKVVIGERMTIAEVAAELERRLGFPAESVVAAAHGSALRAYVGTSAPSLQGYLYPTTYYVSEGSAARDVLRQMADTFAARWRPDWNVRLDSLGLSRHEAVTLASIIAGEMPHPEADERFHVASVYHNRLKRGMRLQADPTVVYALGQRRRLNYADYGIDSEYNTYAFNGLPPGPIAQPSVESLEAALYPTDTEYLYFVARPDGRHEFSETYRQHINTTRRVRGRGR